MRHATRRDVLGCPVDVISLDGVVELVRQAVVTQTPLRLVAINVDQAMKARRDPGFARLLWESDVAFADGVPIVWAASLLGIRVAGRVSGTDLVWRCASVSAETGSVVALVGAGPGVAERTARRMMEQVPGARVLAVPTPVPLGPAENQSVINALRHERAAMVLVALGAPRQERWVRDNLVASGAAVGIGVGSAFDILSGDQPRAPSWMQAHGLEWLYRLVREPRRLAPRYLIEDAPFLWHLAARLVRRLPGIGAYTR